MKVNAYTTGFFAPSARYRVRQLIPYLTNYDINVNEIYSRAGAFPPLGKLNQLSWGIKNILENSIKISQQPEADITWLQKVMFSKQYTFERFLKKPIVFDVDDAIFLKNKGVFAQKIAQKSERIICGNQFLADYFSQWNSRVDIIPTSVDVSKYDAVEKNKNSEIFYILWTGTSSGYPFVYQMEKALKIICNKYNFVKVKIVSDSEPKFTYLEKKDYEFNYWSQEIEFTSIKNADIGIMPLFDNDQTRGKCSYKMLCYMAAKLPVVVSGVGMNNDILNLGEIGYGVNNIDEWVEALELLIESTSNRNLFSKNAYKIVRENFDVNIVANQVYNCFTKVI